MSLMVSISGIRGIVGESLTPDVVVRYAAAYAEYCKRQHAERPVVILGRDGRVTGKHLTHIIASTLISAGVDVRAIGICPTPTVALAVERHHAAGGISVTASHNPMQWNGLKFFAPTGLFLNGEENQILWDIADREPVHWSSWDTLGEHTADDSWIRTHIDAVRGLEYLDAAVVKQRRFRVVLDCVNAAGGRIVPTLLREMGCDVIEMNCDVSGVFAHTPEPIPENLTTVMDRVRAERADLGIVVDPDVDRLVLITEEGLPFGEEYTIASAVRFVLERESRRRREHPPTVVINLSTTRAVEDIARHFGATTLRTPVGEINVARRMVETGAVIGGEGSGGVILPVVHTGRDAIVGIALVLQLLAESGGSLSALKRTMPQYAIAKGKIETGRRNPDGVLERLRANVGTDGTVTTTDGLRIDFPDHWVHLRKSNTEPIVRIIAEAPTMQMATSVVQRLIASVTDATGDQ